MVKSAVEHHGFLAFSFTKGFLSSSSFAISFGILSEYFFAAISSGICFPGSRPVENLSSDESGRGGSLDTNRMVWSRPYSSIYASVYAWVFTVFIANGAASIIGQKNNAPATAMVTAFVESVDCPANAELQVTISDVGILFSGFVFFWYVISIILPSIEFTPKAYGLPVNGSPSIRIPLTNGYFGFSRGGSISFSFSFLTASF